MINLDDEDDEDFNIRPDASSKLANLFGTIESNLDTESSNNALKYTPPKQPKKFEMANNSSDSATNPSVMALIHASAVNVFKFENGKYVAQGKLGAALLGSHDTGVYKLIIYTGKQQHITYASINDNFKLICQPNNYISFYDDNRQNWSVMFDTEDEKLNFSRQLTVCKYNTIAKTHENESRILTQDLVIGDETHPIVAEENDNIELRYKGWMFEDNQTLGKLFANVDNSAKRPFRLKLVGKWSQMLKGLRVGGKRFAVFTPSLRDQFTGILENAPVSENCKYGFQFELVKIQPRTQQKSESTVQSDVKVSTSGSETTDSNPRSHSNSLSDDNKSKQKNDMISRVAKMGGLPILPVKSDPMKAESVDGNDSNGNDSLQPKPLPRPRNNSNITTSEETQINSNAIPLMTCSSHSAQAIPQTIESNLSILTAETRTNQNEIRMNLNKILDKIDSVSEKVNEIKSNSNTQSIGFLDSTLLLSSIQRIVTENTNLKKEVEEKTSSLQKLNEKVVDLLHIQSIRGQESPELNHLRQSEASLRQEISQLNANYLSVKEESEKLKLENNKLKQTVDELTAQIQSRSNFETSSRPSSKEMSTQIKRLMNDVFKRISAQIDENKSYSSEEVIDIVSNCIRNATLAVMDSKNSSRTNSPFRQSVDEIDKNKDNLGTNCDSSLKIEKPSIPRRRSNEKNQTVTETSSEEVIKS